jgi:hypothetical protein
MIRETTQADIEHVCAHMRAEDAVEQFATRFPGEDTPESLARDMVAAMPRAILSSCVLDPAGRPATILSAYQQSPGVARLHRLSTTAWPRVSFRTFEFGMQHFMPALAGVVHRAECSVMARYREAHQILERLDFKQEGIAVARGRDGEDFANFAWVRRHV